MPATASAAATPHSEFSSAWARCSVVSTAYQQHTWASAMSGTTANDTVCTNELLPTNAVRCSIRAHWAAKHNSATVATERPTSTLDSRESISTTRGMSITGRNERNAHPATYTPDNSSM